MDASRSRIEAATLANAIPMGPDRPGQIKAIADREGISVQTFRAWMSLATFLSSEQLDEEVATPCANGNPVGRSTFEVLSPLAGLPQDEAHRHAHELLDFARQGVPVRDIAKRARAIAREHRDGLLADLHADGDGRRDGDGDDQLRAEIADLRREFSELRQEVSAGHARTGSDKDRDPTGSNHVSEGHRPQRPLGASEDHAPGGSL